MMKLPKHFLLIPALGLVGLAVAGVDMVNRPRPGDAEPYHLSVREASVSVPERVGEWTWMKEITFPDAAANALLKPNVLIQRRYRRGQTGQYLTLMFDQVKVVEAMLGHYPPNCYKGLGQVLTRQRPLTLHMAHAGGVTDVEAMEYIFLDKTRDSRQMIFNFLILPSGRFVNNMEDVEVAARDFEQRCYGVAQMQLVFPMPQDLSETQLQELRAENEKTVESFLSSVSDLLKVIYSGGRS